MSGTYTIENTNTEDLEFIYKLFDESIKYQERKGTNVWRHYDQGALVRDIQNKNQYKILIDSRIGIVFSVNYADKIIWRELENGDALYLHRIVVNPLFKGQKLFGLILEWAVSHARQKGIRFIRMDTWADNQAIIDYYQIFGFTFKGNFTTPDSVELPVHNRNLALALLEMKA